MKTLLNLALLSLVLLTSSCSTDNFKQDLTTLDSTESFAARFINETMAQVDLIVYDFDGNVVSTNQSINPGESFDIASLSSKEATFVIGTGTSDRIVSMDINSKNSYHIILNEDSAISTIQTARL